MGHVRLRRVLNLEPFGDFQTRDYMKYNQRKFIPLYEAI